jgi:hypothetical protein
MIIYSVTVNIDESVHEDWLKWMKETHIPEVLATGLFSGYAMMKVLSKQTDEAGVSYNIQYKTLKMDNYTFYRDNFARQLQTKTEEKWKGQFVAFRTLLQEV